MNLESQRTEIAKACGWTDIQDAGGNPPDWYVDLFGGLSGNDPQTGARALVPDYLEDLNAMREALKILNPERCSTGGEYTSPQWERYFGLICKNAARDNVSVAFAPASLQAECFLRALDLWIKEENTEPIRADMSAEIQQPTSSASDAASCSQCHRCIRDYDIKGPSGMFPLNAERMILCPECGNKRCPKASDHRLACTGSNEPGQPGSIFAANVQVELPPNGGSESKKGVVGG